MPWHYNFSQKKKQPSAFFHYFLLLGFMLDSSIDIFVVLDNKRLLPLPVTLLTIELLLCPFDWKTLRTSPDGLLPRVVSTLLLLMTFWFLRTGLKDFESFLYLTVRFSYRIRVSSRVIWACCNSCVLFMSPAQSIFSICFLDNPNISWANELKSIPLLFKQRKCFMRWNKWRLWTTCVIWTR